MKRSHNLFACVVLALAGIGCAVPEGRGPNQGTEPYDNDVFDARNCNENGGYTRGYNDARAGKSMELLFASRCREDLRRQAEKGYRIGYDAGEKSLREAEANRTPPPAFPTNLPPPSAPSQKNTTINVNLGGTQNVGGGQNPPPSVPQSNQKAWYCEVEAFQDKFSAFGATQLEAKQATQNQCTAKHNAMFCRKIDCQPNQ